MLGARQGFTARVKQVDPNVQVVHCRLRRENLAAQHLSGDLSAVMQEVVGVVNFIESSAVNSRLFEQMCVDLRCVSISGLNSNIYSNPMRDGFVAVSSCAVW